MNISKHCLFVLTAAFFSTTTFAFEGKNCVDLFLKSNDYFHFETDGRITFGSVGANARSYPKNMTLELMGLSNEKIAQLAPGKVLILGEGFGNLLPQFLTNKDLQVTAVDPIYGIKEIPSGFMGTLLRKYIDLYRTHLRAESAASLSDKDNSIDYIYSNLLINNLLHSTKTENGSETLEFSPLAIQVICESARVLKPGKTFVFSMLADANDFLELTQKLTLRYGSTEAMPFTLKAEHSQMTFDYSKFGEYGPDLREKPSNEMSITRVTLIKK